MWIKQALFHVSHPPVDHPGLAFKVKAEAQVRAKLLLLSHLLTSYWPKQMALTYILNGRHEELGLSVQSLYHSAVVASSSHK